MALTQEVLDTFSCGAPECDEDHGPFYFHARCHLEAPTWAYYRDGVITIQCAKCDNLIAEIKVARTSAG